MKTPLLTRTLSIGVVGLVFYSASIDASNLESLELEELMHINVSVGSLFDENELGVGNTIDVVDHDDWHQSGAKDFNAAVSHLPSVLPLENLWGSAISIRGFTNNLSVRGVGILVDGISVNNLSDMSSLYDRTMQNLGGLDKIEVLRGPGSAVHGTDAFHGVFSLHTFDRDEDYSSVKAEVGSDNWREATLRNSSAIGAWRVNASISKSDQGDRDIAYAYTDPFTGEELYSSRKYANESSATVVKAKGALTESINAEVAGYYSEWQLDEGFGPARGGFGLSVAGERDVTDNNARFSMVKLHFDTVFLGSVFGAINFYQWTQKMSRSTDFTTVAGYYDYFTNKKSEEARGADITFRQNAEANILNTQWLVRYQFRESKINDDSIRAKNIITGTESNILLSDKGYEREVNSVAFQVKSGFYRDVFYLLFGGRIDDYDDVGEHLTPKAGLIYHPTDHSSIKFIYGQAFRAPSANELLGNNFLITGLEANSEINPETIDTYELSYLVHMNKNRLLLTVFQSEWRDGIVIESNSYQNREKNSSNGLEAGFDGYFGSWSYKLNGSYVESENVSGNYEYGAFPQYIFNIGFGYQWPSLDLAFFWNNRVMLEMEEGPISTVDADPEELPSYYRSDLHVDWKPFQQLNVWVDIRNLFDRDNYLPSVWNVENGYMEESSNISIGFDLSFN